MSLSRAWKESLCQVVLRAWHLARILTGRLPYLNYWMMDQLWQIIFLAVRLTGKWKERPRQAAPRACCLATISTRARNQWLCQVFFGTWHLDRITTGASKNWPCQAVFWICHLAMILTSAWKMLICQAVFRAWHSAPLLTRALKEWHCQAVFKIWGLDSISTRALVE